MIISLVLSLSCVELTYNTKPFGSVADRQWNSEILLAGEEVEEVMMYGILISVPDMEISICTGFGGGICLDQKYLNYFRGDKNER